ncbi:DUF1934 domain-containing protein [Streptococcus oriscaviae]|uniref:DUF1934 domain-containing protein n=1 Tax=Streptococcus oriscaviae TaxID=2781599 RepID=A0ABX7YM01_9STRE|nr:DUF1934 domain-containing protein [Streptococcus oriscaviae]QUE54289.1 DUF1934 domain-containing protein [Streptococcus oriscaviae]
MQIRLRNEIDLDGQLEVIDQVYPVEVTEKNNQLYLIFLNEEKEKVLIKSGENELVMTRFSDPKSIMRFLADKDAVISLPTPVGIQHFVTSTHRYGLDRNEQEIKLDYDLKTLETGQLFARYRMTISWR